MAKGSSMAGLLMVPTFAATAWAQGAPPGASAPADAEELRISLFEALLGAEVAVEPKVRDGETQEPVHAETAVSGIEYWGVKSSEARSRLLEWTTTARLKAGSGLPADTFPGDERTTALGIQLAARADLGFLPLGTRCGTLYVGAGVGAEGKATVMGSSGEGSSHGISATSPDAQMYLYARAGLGVACVTGDLSFVASPFVAQRADSMADGNRGTELGGRAAVWLATRTAAALEAATMSTSDSVTSTRTTRASLSLRHRFGARMILGTDASVTRNRVDEAGPFPYRERITPFAVTVFVAMKL